MEILTVIFLAWIFWALFWESKKENHIEDVSKKLEAPDVENNEDINKEEKDREITQNIVKKEKQTNNKEYSPPYHIYKGTLLRGILREYRTFERKIKYNLPRTLRAKNPPGYKLFPHQRKAVRFILHNKRGLIWHSPGSGKTITSIATIYNLMQKNEDQVQVIVVTTSRTIPTWESKLEELKQNVSGKLEYRVLSYNYVGMNNNFPIFVNPKAVRVFILDEAHHIKGRKVWWEATYNLITKFAPNYVLLLTATPVKTNADLLYLYAILYPERASEILQNAGTYLLKDGIKIRGTDNSLRKFIMKKTHLYFHKPLFEAVDVHEVYVDYKKEERADLVFIEDIIKSGKKPILYVGKVEDGKETARFFRNRGFKVSEIMISYPEKIEEADLYVMTYQMGEGVDMKQFADTVIFIDLPYGLEVFLQNIFRIVRIDSDLKKKYNVYILRSYRSFQEKNGKLLDRYRSQLAYWFDLNRARYYL